MAEIVKKRKWQKVLLIYGGAFALIVLLLLLSIYVLFFNPFYYNYLFKHFGVQSELGITTHDLKLVRNNIIGYFALFKTSLQTEVTIGGSQTLFYTTDELAHMGDVRVIFEAFLFFFVLAAAVLAFALRLFFQNRKDTKIRKHSGIALIVASSTIILLFVPIIIGILVDFDKFFTLFHDVLFPQGNWQFDYDSLMLTLLPEDLFLKGALHIGLAWSISLTLTLTGGIVLLCWRHKSVAKPHLSLQK